MRSLLYSRLEQLSRRIQHSCCSKDVIILSLRLCKNDEAVGYTPGTTSCFALQISLFKTRRRAGRVGQLDATNVCWEFWAQIDPRLAVKLRDIVFLTTYYNNILYEEYSPIFWAI